MPATVQTDHNFEVSHVVLFETDERFNVLSGPGDRKRLPLLQTDQAFPERISPTCSGQMMSNLFLEPAKIRARHMANKRRRIPQDVSEVHASCDPDWHPNTGVVLQHVSEHTKRATRASQLTAKLRWAVCLRSAQSFVEVPPLESFYPRLDPKDPTLAFTTEQRRGEGWKFSHAHR